MRMKLAMLAGAAAILSLNTMTASAKDYLLGNPLCDQAVSVTACKTHLAYLAGHPFIDNSTDTSPYYMQVIDPRHNKTLLDAGGPGGGGGGSE